MLTGALRVSIAGENPAPCNASTFVKDRLKTDGLRWRMKIRYFFLIPVEQRFLTDQSHLEDLALLVTKERTG
jgi:hypothetical protein